MIPREAWDLMMQSLKMNVDLLAENANLQAASTREAIH